MNDWQGKPKYCTRRKPVPVLLRPPQIPDDLNRVRTRMPWWEAGDYPPELRHRATKRLSYGTVSREIWRTFHHNLRECTNYTQVAHRAVCNGIRDPCETY
jgi:hypothetical protein